MAIEPCSLTSLASRQTSQWYKLCGPMGLGDTEMELILQLYNFSANLVLFLLILYFWVSHFVVLVGLSSAGHLWRAFGLTFSL